MKNHQMNGICAIRLVIIIITDVVQRKYCYRWIIVIDKSYSLSCNSNHKLKYLFHVGYYIDNIFIYICSLIYFEIFIVFENKCFVIVNTILMFIK